MKKVKLIDAPIGLFWYKGELCIKTKHFDSSGNVQAYSVDTGNLFYINEQSDGTKFNDLIVIPLNYDDVCIAFEQANMLPVDRQYIFYCHVLRKD